MKSSFILTCLILCAAPAFADDAPVFNRDILPILSQNCFHCHGQDENTREADLRLDQRESATKPNGDGFAAIVPNKPEKSILIERINSKDDDTLMPPPSSNHVLKSEQKKLLADWISSGAEYKPHWAYVAPVRPKPPEVDHKKWPRNPIDNFVLDKLEREGLKPSPEADRRTLIRRLTLDLIGMPPSVEEVEDFVNDTRDDAYERVVDRLMSSEHYGERMALPWLDAARYADSNGFQQDGDTYQWVWRDWLVRALNRDMPFDQFTIEQLAGDLLPNPTPEQVIATAFNRNHLINGEGGAIPEEQRFNVLVDRVDTTATTFLALTMACSQCHDHKYDPITQKDYYSLMASFNQVSETGIAGGKIGTKFATPPFISYSTPENQKKLQQLRAEVQKLEKSLDRFKEKLFKKWLAEEFTEKANNFPQNLIAIMKIEKKDRSKKQEEVLQKGIREYFFRRVLPRRLPKMAEAKELEVANQKATDFEVEFVPRVMVMRDDKPRETFILDRGDYLKPKKDGKVEFSTPAFLLPMAGDAPKNRLGFAKWLFQPNHPLTSRVQVNRMWQLFFGTGLVKTTEDFGVQGEVPTHQGLLDWLAVEFQERGWSPKHMHRLIVTSATYRQSSKVTPELFQRDPENRLMARASRFRMPSMVLRDVALAASGLLDKRVYGAPVYPYQPEGIWQSLAVTDARDFNYYESTGNDLYRRSLYTFWRRTIAPANMFDASSRQTCKVRSSVTSTPLHALTTLNDKTWNEASRVLAERAMQSCKSVEDQIKFAFGRVIGREPSSTEGEILQRAFEKQKTYFATNQKNAVEVVSIGAAIRDSRLSLADHAAMSAVCLAIFNMDEALTRE